ITLADWFGQEGRRIYGVLGESDEERDRRQLVELIAQHGGSVTPRDLMRSSRRYAQADDANVALDELARAGIGQWRTVPPPRSGGHASRELVLLPTVDARLEIAGKTQRVSTVSTNGIALAGAVLAEAAS